MITFLYFSLQSDEILTINDKLVVEQQMFCSFAVKAIGNIDKQLNFVRHSIFLTCM